MKTVDLDDDVYTFIASKTLRIGESASDILRRLLDIRKASSAKESIATRKHELSEAIANPNFIFHSSKDQFLSILSEAHRQKRSEFEKVLSLRGRDRLYFAKSDREILASGSSTHPKKIPGSDYWVMTNASNVKKAEMLESALRVLGFSNDACKEAKSAIS